MTKPTQWQNRPRPSWVDWPEGWHGACPHRIGPNLIIAYLGFERRDRRSKEGKGQHIHLTRCLSCGSITERRQASILASARKGAKGCVACTRKLKGQTEKDYEKRRRQLAEKGRDEWLWVLQTMPVTPREFIPEEMRCDGR